MVSILEAVALGVEEEEGISLISSSFFSAAMLNGVRSAMRGECMEAQYLVRFE